MTMIAKNQSYGPRYYKRGSIEVWDFIRDQRLNYHLGNAVKYICRYGHKGDYNDQLSDINKAIHYLENERDFIRSTRNSEDLPRYHSEDSIKFTGSGIPGGLSDSILDFPSGESQAAQPYSGGIQGISGSGRDVISF